MNAQDVLGYRWEYTGPAPVCRGGSPTTAESKGFEEAGQQQGLANDTLGKAGALATSNPQGTPFYKSLLTAGTEATSRAYDNAQKSLLAKSNAAGFGYAQPVTQGAQAEVGGREAEALGKLPAAATQQAEQTQLEQSGLLNQEAGIESGAAGSYFGTGAKAEQAQLDRNAAFWNSMLQVPGQIAKVARG